MAECTPALYDAAKALADYFEKSLNVAAGPHPQQEAFLWANLRVALSKAVPLTEVFDAANALLDALGTGPLEAAVIFGPDFNLPEYEKECAERLAKALGRARGEANG